MAITEEQLAQKIRDTFDAFSDVQTDPKEAREQQAKAIANAIMLFVIGRETLVTGTSATGGPVTGKGIIQL